MQLRGNYSMQVIAVRTAGKRRKPILQIFQLKHYLREGGYYTLLSSLVA